MSRIYIPTRGADDWQRFLAHPDTQWKTGYSARTLAHCWEKADGLPPELSMMLRPHGGDVELLLAIPEHKVPLPGAARGDSQNDIFALTKVGTRTFAIAVEGKVNEPFGETVGEWLKDASAGKRERLEYICGLLGLDLPLPDHIYYQLLHRSASAVIESRRFKTDAAAMIVHSFSSERRWFDAFSAYAGLFKTDAKAGDLVAVRPNDNPPFYIGWACGDCSFLAS